MLNLVYKILPNDGSNCKTLNTEDSRQVFLKADIRDVAPSLKVSVKFQDIPANTTKKCISRV